MGRDAGCGTRDAESSAASRAPDTPINPQSPIANLPLPSQGRGPGGGVPPRVPHPASRVPTYISPSPRRGGGRGVGFPHASRVPHPASRLHPIWHTFPPKSRSVHSTRRCPRSASPSGRKFPAQSPRHPHAWKQAPIPRDWPGGRGEQGAVHAVSRATLRRMTTKVVSQTPYFISTAIPYVNARPHIGHALEFVLADAYARYQRQQGRDVFFLSGSDEN